MTDTEQINESCLIQWNKMNFFVVSLGKLLFISLAELNDIFLSRDIENKLYTALILGRPLYRNFEQYGVLLTFMQSLQTVLMKSN